MTRLIGILAAAVVGLAGLAAAPATASTTPSTPSSAGYAAAGQSTTRTAGAEPRARYWSCTRIENEFVSIIGAWGANPALGPQVNTAVRTLITHVRNKATKRLMRQVLLVQDPFAPDSVELFNAILTRIARGQC
jgi:hypothetical protein